MSIVLVNFLIVIIGSIAVLLTAYFSVKSSVVLGYHFGLSDELIGMTVLSVGTSLPEIMTHIVCSLKILEHPQLLNNLSGLVLGTNIGSDIFQQNFVLSIVAIVGIVTVEKNHLFKDMGGLIFASLLVLIFGLNGIISRFEGFILFFGYILYLFMLKKRGMIEEKSIVKIQKKQVFKNIIILILSFTIMAFSADKVVDSSEMLIKQLHISASYFGIIVLGVASAMPELTTSLIAIFKKKKAISAGILIGSNVTNPMFALGLGALISTYTVPQVVILLDLPFKIFTALLILYFLWKHEILKKKNAIALICIYLTYIYVRNLWFPVDF